MAGPEWSQLPPELIFEISTSLKTYTDHLTFRSICHTWRSSVPKAPTHLPPQLPWLLLSYNKINNQLLALFDFSTNKTHLISLPEAAKKLPISSSHGFLAILEDSPNILLINPLTRAKFNLPPLSTFPDVISFNYSHIGREYTVFNGLNGETRTLSLRQMRDSFISKLVLSSNPTNPTGFFAAAILGWTDDVAYCKNGDSSWTKVNAARSYCDDILFFNGKFHAVKKTGQIAVIEVNVNPPTVKFIETTDQGGDMQYQVGYEDELLLVSRFLEDSYWEANVKLRTVRFEVFRMELDGPRWERVSSLGERALFVGKNASVWVWSRDFPGCVGDCVYYSDDLWEIDFDDEFGGCRDWDLGVFRMWDGSIEPLLCCPLDSGRLWPPPVWVCPNPC